MSIADRAWFVDYISGRRIDVMVDYCDESAYGEGGDRYPEIVFLLIFENPFDLIQNFGSDVHFQTNNIYKFKLS